MVGRDRLVIVDYLLARPFPSDRTRENRLFSGPGFHVHVLEASQSFWDDRSQEIVEAAEAGIDTAFQGVATALTLRWGEPETIDLKRYLWAGGLVPEPMIQLCQLSNEILVWRPRACGRWVSLTVGQGDPELPIELRLAVGEAALH